MTATKSASSIKTYFDLIIAKYTWITKHEFPITHIKNEDMRVLNAYAIFFTLTDFHRGQNLHPHFLKMFFKREYEREVTVYGKSLPPFAPHPFEVKYASFLISLPKEYVNDEDKEIIADVAFRKLINT